MTEAEKLHLLAAELRQEAHRVRAAGEILRSRDLMREAGTVLRRARRIGI